MPVFGDVNHGFYNIHPTVYLDLAEANGYIVEDIRYFDQINRRTDEHVRSFRDDVDFDALPIGRTQLESHMTIGAEIDKNLLAVRSKHRARRPGTMLSWRCEKCGSSPFDSHPAPVRSVAGESHLVGCLLRATATLGAACLCVRVLLAASVDMCRRRSAAATLACA